jgi:hypothetical protein
MVGAMDPATQNNVYSEFEANRKRMFLKIQFTSTRDELDNVMVFFKENSHFLMLVIDFQIYSQCQLPVPKVSKVLLKFAIDRTPSTLVMDQFELGALL